MRVFLIAGEPSGDRLGAAAMAGLRSLRPDAEFDGIGGDLMGGQGLRSRFPMSDLSVMGLAEVLPRLPALLRRRNEAVRAVLDWQPDVLLTIDAPDFGLRVAKAVRARAPGVRTVHYVAPTVWAWRPGRARRMAPFVDQVLALFPFEPPLMEAAGIACDFVGHPVAAEPVATDEEIRNFRWNHGIGDAPLVIALPGSRASEVERLSATFGEALGLLGRRVPGLRVVLPAAAPVVDLVRERVAGWPVRPILVEPRGDPEGAAKRAAFRAADAALAASGTVSLELAAAATPMVVAYDMNRLTWAVMRRMVHLDTVTLVNIVSDTRAVPEFLGPDCRPGPIAESLARVLESPEAQWRAMRVTMERLGAGGEPPGLRAARAILTRL